MGGRTEKEEVGPGLSPSARRGTGHSNRSCSSLIVRVNTVGTLSVGVLRAHDIIWCFFSMKMEI